MEFSIDILWPKKFVASIIKLRTFMVYLILFFFDYTMIAEKLK